MTGRRATGQHAVPVFVLYNIPGAAAQQQFDPLWGTVAPAARAWFSQQALQLAQQANPPLSPGAG